MAGPCGNRTERTRGSSRNSFEQDRLKPPVCELGNYALIQAASLWTCKFWLECEPLLNAVLGSNKAALSRKVSPTLKTNFATEAHLKWKGPLGLFLTPLNSLRHDCIRLALESSIYKDHVNEPEGYN